jgi:superfamily II DNA or RNA helicase
MSTTIKVQNCYSFLYTDNENLRKKLWEILRFRENNYYHSRLYKQKLWDGYLDFFKLKTGKFLTGLLADVEFALKNWGIDYKIIDERNCLEFKYNSVDKYFLNQWINNNNKIELYDYQVDFINSAIKYKRGIVLSPTSSGKTEIMIGFLKALPQNCPTLILANKTSLVAQNYERMSEWGFKNIGRVYGSGKDGYFEPNVLTCATVQSIHKIEKLLPHIKALVVDEVHDMMSKVPKFIYDNLTSCSVRLAVSATPFKFGGKDKCHKYFTKGYFGPVFKTNSDVAEKGIVKTKKLQERGTLSASKCNFIKIVTPDLFYQLYQDAITLGIVQNLDFHSLVKKIALNQTGRTLILVERLDHGDYLSEMIPDSFWVKGEDNLKTRKYVIEKLQKDNKENAIAIATQGIFNTGINFHVHNLINAAGGKADHLIIQRVGRGLRTANDKDVLNYYDFYFENNEYLLKHSRKRVKILKEEGHEVNILESYQ